LKLMPGALLAPPHNGRVAEAALGLCSVNVADLA
jgi:hypothetical protein